MPEKLTTAQTRLTPWFLGAFAVGACAVATFDRSDRQVWIVFGVANAVYSLRGFRAGAICSDNELEYRGIFRSWRLGWDRIAGFEKTRWQSEGGTTEYPVVLVEQPGARRPSRRRMYALGSRPARNREPSEVDELMKQLRALLGASRHEQPSAPHDDTAD